MICIRYDLLRVMTIITCMCVHMPDASGRSGGDLPEVYEQISGMLDHDQVAEAVRRIDDLLQQRGNDHGLAQLAVILRARLRRMNGDVRGAYQLVDSLEVNGEWPHGHLLQYLVMSEKARDMKSLKLYDKAEAFALHALSISTDHGLVPEQIDTHILLAEIKRRQFQPDAAMARLNTAERMMLHVEHPKGRCNALINRANILYDQDDIPGAIEKYREALSCAEAGGFPVIAENAIFNIASATSKLPAGAEPAIAFLATQLNTPRAQADPSLRSEILSNMGLFHNGVDQPKEARILLGESRRLASSVHDTAQMADVDLYLFRTYTILGYQDSARQAIEHAADLLKHSGNLQRLMEVEQRQAEMYRAMGDHKTAWDHLVNSREYSDSLNKRFYSDELANLHVAFDSEKKDARIKLQESNIKRQRVGLIAGGSVLALLAMITLVLMVNLRQRRQLAEKERRLHEQQVNDLMQQQEIRALDAMMEGQEKERKRVAKDLHDRLGSMLSAIKLQFSALESKVEQVQREQKSQYDHVFTMLDDAVSEVRRVSHDMVRGSLAQFGLRGALEDLRTALNVPGKLEVEMNLFGLDGRLDQKVEIGVYRMIQECVNNAMKHSRAQHLSISVTHSAAILNIMVEDDGVGFDPEAIKEGMGLGNLRQRAAELNGQVRFDSRPGRGTTVNIDIPLA
jgi:signal transduction histidine kinase